MTRDDAQQAVFGMLDGIASALGLVLAVAGTPGLATTVCALTVGSGVSMAVGEWLSDATGSLRRALVMGVCTAAGVALPALPWFLTGGAVAYAASAGIVAGLGVCIAEIRPEPPLRSYLKTFAAIGVAAGLATFAGAAA